MHKVYSRAYKKTLTTVRLVLVTEKDVAPIDAYVRPILFKPIRGTWPSTNCLVFTTIR